MTPVPLDLPIRTSEAADLADLIFDVLGDKPIKDDLRLRLAGRGSTIEMETIKPCWGSIAADPTHPTSYYIAIDGWRQDECKHLLLHIAPASAPSSSLFGKQLLIGRMRTPTKRDVVVNSVPFDVTERERVHTFATKVDKGFQPRPHGAASAICAETADGEGAFEGFRSLLKLSNVNWASFCGDLTAIQWAAIRAGWREGFSAAPPRVVVDSPDNLDAVKDSLTAASAYSHFIVDATPLISAGESKYDACLRVYAELHEHIRRAKMTSQARTFDFEIALGACTPEELTYCLEKLKSAGRPAQLVAVKATDPAAIAALALAARPHGAALSYLASGEEPVDRITQIGRASMGRLNYHAPLANGGQVVSLAAALRA